MRLVCEIFLGSLFCPNISSMVSSYILINLLIKSYATAYEHDEQATKYIMQPFLTLKYT